MSEILKLRPTDEGALIQLGIYKTLNSTQLARMLGYAPKTMSTSLRRLKDAGLTEAINFGVAPREGKLPALHFLKAKGVRVLQEWGESCFERPTGTFRINPRTYFHREGLIDIHVSFDSWIKDTPYTVDFYEKDFEVTGANRGGKKDQPRTPLTKIPIGEEDDFIIPDSIFAFSRPDSSKGFYLVEYHRGKDTKRLLEQLVIIALSIQKGYPTRQYLERVGKANPRVLVVCELEATKRHIARRIFEDERLSLRHKELFAFAFIEEVREDFSKAFKTLQGEPSIL